jgi:hypothetical protein
VFANHPERYSDEIPDPDTFRSLRARLGVLLLLPSSDNASFNDAPYDEKINYYSRHNRLAAILDPNSQRRNPSAHRGTTYTAHIDANGHIRLHSGDHYRKPDDAARIAVGIKNISGMAFWHVDDFNGQALSLKDVFAQAQRNGLLPTPKSGRRYHPLQDWASRPRLAARAPAVPHHHNGSGARGSIQQLKRRSGSADGNDGQ